jgi:hypothetical protein
MEGNTKSKGQRNFRTAERSYRDTRLGGGASKQVDWLEVDAEELRGFVANVVEAGGCVILGRTSDGGAYSITIILGDERIKDWPNSAEAALVTFSAFKNEYVQ